MFNFFLSYLKPPPQFLLGVYQSLYNDIFEVALGLGYIIDPECFSNVYCRDKRCEDLIRQNTSPVAEAPSIKPRTTPAFESHPAKDMPKSAMSTRVISPRSGSEPEEEITQGTDLTAPPAASGSSTEAPPLAVSWGDKTEICGVCNLKVLEHRFCSATGTLHVSSASKPAALESLEEPHIAQAPPRHATYDDSLLTAFDRVRNNSNFHEGVFKSVVEQVLDEPGDDINDVFCMSLKKYFIPFKWDLPEQSEETANIQNVRYRKNIYSGPEQNWNTPKNRRLFQFCSAPALFWGGIRALSKKTRSATNFFLPKDALCTWVGWEWG